MLKQQLLVKKTNKNNRVLWANSWTQQLFQSNWACRTPATTRATTPHPISRSPQPSRWPGTRWTHQRVPNPQQNHKDPVMATQRHSTLQTTHFHAAINEFFFLTRQSHLCKIKNIYKFHCSFSDTEYAEVGTGSRRLLCCHQVVLEHPSRLRHTLMDVASA